MALLETLTDEFDTALNTALWSGFGGAATSAGRLALPNTASYPNVDSVASYDMRASRITFAAVEPLPAGTGGNECWGAVRLSKADQNNVTRWAVQGGTLKAQVINAGVTTETTIGAFSAALHACLRMSADAAGSTITFATSPDGVTWTTRATHTVTWSTAAVFVQIQAGAWKTETAATAYFGAVNPTPAVSLTVAYRGDTAAATLPADGALTAGNITAGAGGAIVVPRASDPAYDPNKIWSAAPPASTTNLAAAITNNCYFEVTLSRTGGMTLQTLRLKGARAGSSTPRGFAIRSSVDGYVANLIAADIATVAPTLTQYSADISALGTRTSVTFRVFYYSPGTGSLLHFDDLEVDYVAGGSGLNKTKLGSGNISALKLGTSDIQALYIGTTKIWP